MCIFRYLDSQTTLFLNTSNVPDGYLPIKDYEFVDKSTKEHITNVKAFSFDDEYISYGYDNGLETTLGISTNSTWDEFVEAYGSYTACYILASVSNYDSEDYDYVYLNWITVEDFDNEYIQTGKVSLDTYDIDIAFSTIVKNNKAYYTQGSQNKIRGEFRLSKLHEFDLSFSYRSPSYEYNDAGKGIFNYINCYEYVE